MEGAFDVITIGTATQDIFYPLASDNFKFEKGAKAEVGAPFSSIGGGAVNAAVDLICKNKTAAEATGCVNLDSLVTEIQLSVDLSTCKRDGAWLPGEKVAYANEVSRRNVLRTMRMITERSSTLAGLVQGAKLVVVGALYDIQTGRVDFFQTQDSNRSHLSIPTVGAL